MWSALTDDMKHCYISGKTPVHIHHIFYGKNRKLSGEYGFIVPLSPELHTGDKGIHSPKGNKALDWQLKYACQETWLEQGHTKKEFIDIFGKWYSREDFLKEPRQLFD